jgi:hypothetical protein
MVKITIPISNTSYKLNNDDNPHIQNIFKTNIKSFLKIKYDKKKSIFFDKKTSFNLLKTIVINANTNC